MTQIERYSADKAQEWDAFVRTSKNGTFLFLRGYMDYHSDRFTDHSLLFRNEKGMLTAVLPANETDMAELQGRKSLVSHQGLTYGGLLMTEKTHAKEVLEFFRMTIDYLRKNGFGEWIYKQIPHIYHRIPAQEDDYALWRCEAEPVVCNLATVADYHSWTRKSAEYCRRNAMMQAEREGLRIDFSASLDRYWSMLTACLKERYNATPVHSLEEIKRLKALFPDNIRCCTVEGGKGTMLAGVVLFLCGQTIHVQYSASTANGRQSKAQDYLYLALVNHFSTIPEVRFFDFGTSNEEGGKVLNTTLNRYKEGFGARGVTYRQWRIKTTK